MPAATVNGTAYPATLTTDHEALTRDGYTQDLKLVTARGGSASSRRVWPVLFGILSSSELSTLRALVKAPGSVTFGGDIVGSPAVACLATNIEWWWDNVADCFLRCEMVEVTPS